MKQIYNMVDQATQTEAVYLVNCSRSIRAEVRYIQVLYINYNNSTIHVVLLSVASLDFLEIYNIE